MILKSLAGVWLAVSIVFTNTPITVVPTTPEKPVVLWYQQGSGFLIDDQGDVATAAHVVQGTNLNTLTVTYNGQKVHATLIDADYEHDVAILHMQLAKPTPYFTLTNPVAHTTAYIKGYPAVTVFGLWEHITSGEIAFNSTFPDTFSIYGRACHGNSGGVVTNDRGDAIGILVYGFGDLSIYNALCSDHSGARYVTNLVKIARLHHLPISYSPKQSLGIVHRLFGSTDQQKIVFIQADVDNDSPAAIVQGLSPTDHKHNIDIIKQKSKQVFDSKVQADLAAAQAILESNLYGKPSDLAYKDNNLFGIKGKGTAGSIAKKTTEYKIRKYTTTAYFSKNLTLNDSFEQYKALMKKPLYKDVSGSKTFEEAVINLQKTGYATDPSYSKQLLSIYKRYIQN